MAVSFAQESFAGGMNDSKGRVPLSGAQAELIENGRIQEDGSIKCRAGSKLTASDPANNSFPAMLAPLSNTSNQVRWILGSGVGVQYSLDYGANWTNVGTTSAATGNYCYADVSGSNYLFFTDSTSLYYTNGPSITTLAYPTIPITAPVWVASHGDRVWIARSDSQTIYASKIGDPATWTTPDGLSLRVAGDGEPINGMFDVGEALLIFKRSGISYVVGYGNSDIVVAAGARAFGENTIVFPQTVVKTPYGVIWTSRDGIQRFNGLGQGIETLSHAADEFWADLKWSIVMYNGLTGSKLQIPCAAYLPNTAEYVVALQSTNMSDLDSSCDILVRLNLKTGAITYDRIAAGNITALMASPISSSSGETFLISAAGDGKVRVHDATSSYKDNMASDLSGGTAYSLTLRTPHTKLNYNGKKRVRMLQVGAEWGSVGGSLTAKVYADNTLDTTGSSTTGSALTVSTTNKVQYPVARTSLRGTDFQVEVTATPTNATLPRITSVAMTGEALKGIRDTLSK